MRLRPCALRARLCALLMAAACAAGGGQEARDAAPSDAAASYSGRPLAWQRVRAEVEADGLTRALEFALPSAARVFALRTYPVMQSEALSCFALRELVVNGTHTWIGADRIADNGDYCTECEQRVSIGRGYGFFVLPSAAAAELEIKTVNTRIALRDCLTLTARRRSADSATELWVELASWTPPEPATPLRLPLAVVVASRPGLGSDPALLPAALDTLRDIWAGAGIQIVVESSVELTAPDSPVVYSALDQQALVRLAKRARAGITTHARTNSWPVLILAPCLRREDVITGGQTEPWAVTPHLPGGAALGDEPDPIFIAAERCEGLSPAQRFMDAAQLGTVMAHELGHYLGLYHVTEYDGREDALSDTDLSEPNLMQATPSSSATTLSASQIAIARRHSAFVSTP